ncbi:hypothetical protein ACFQ6Q_00585 [Streptomyces sp. NPDC056437]|uniref:hypothetical protein n=1 Tax=Streptomyces sp. NPDC056437 TaxID=3345816 RepID=UPI0036A235B0
MSQQYPHNPQQPQGQQPYGQHTFAGGPAPYQPPPPPKKGMSGWAITGIVIGGIFAFLIVIGVASGGTETSDSSGKAGDKSAAAPQKPAEQPAEQPAVKEDPKPADKPAAKPAEKKPAPAPKDLSPADEFKAFVAKNGTQTEKAAVKHVTKVQGAEEQNDILDSAEVYTDFTGGFMSKDQNQAKLIASAFADWKDSENGLVTVYGSDGDMISNGNF